MQYPKICSVTALDNHLLLIEFDNHERRIYDVKPLLEIERFMPLKNITFFKNVMVEIGGYAIVWNNEIDISEYELWTKGMTTEFCQKSAPSIPKSSARIKIHGR